MPERDLEVDATSVLVEWGSIRLIGPGRLRLTSLAVELDATGGSWQASYDELQGAGWRRGSLTVHGDQGRAVVESKEGLELIWVQLLERACPLPELARDHRLLGRRRRRANAIPRSAARREEAHRESTRPGVTHRGAQRQAASRSGEYRVADDCPGRVSGKSSGSTSAGGGARRGNDGLLHPTRGHGRRGSALPRSARIGSLQRLA